VISLTFINTDRIKFAGLVGQGLQGSLRHVLARAAGAASLTTDAPCFLLCTLCVADIDMD